MSKIKIINSSADTIAMMIQSGFMIVTGAQETVNLTPSIMYVPLAHVIEEKSYVFPISVVSDLNNIIRCSIFVPGVIDEFFNGALNVVDYTIFSSFENIELYHLSQKEILTT